MDRRRVRRVLSRPYGHWSGSSGTSYSSGVDFSNGLVAYLPFAEASGNRVDLIGPYTFVLSGTEPGRSAGWPETFSLGLIAANDTTRLTLGTPPSTFDFNTQMTVAVWMNVYSNYNYNEPINHYTGTAATSAWALSGGQNGELIGTVYGNNGNSSLVTGANGTIRRNRWQLHFLWTDNVGTGTAYVQTWDLQQNPGTIASDEGFLLADTKINFPASTSIIVANVRVAIANHTVHGLMGSVAVWNRALTVSERAAYFASGHGRAYPLTAANGQVLESLDPDDDMVGAWKLGEATGTTRVDSVGTNDFTDNGSVPKVAGKIGDAASFNGTSQYLSKASPTGIPSGDVDYSISFWINPTNVTQNTVMPLSFGQSGVSFNWDFAQLTTDLQFRVWAGGSSVGQVTMNGLVAGSWQHVFVQHDSARNLLFARLGNGVTVQAASGAPTTSAAQTLVIGGSSGGSNLWNGSVDALMIFDAILNGYQFDALWNSGNGAEPPFA